MTMDGIHRGRARLRWLLTVIVLLAVMPVFVLYVVRLQGNSEAALQQARDRAVVLAREGAVAHEQMAQQAFHLLELISQIPAVRAPNPSECDKFLKWIHEGRHWVTGIFVVGPNGKGLCGSLDAVKTLDVTDRSYFRDAMQTGGFVLSDVIIGRLTGRPIVVAALPIHTTDGDVSVVVGVGVDLPWINKIAGAASAKYGGILIAVDRQGHLIAYQPELPPGWAIGQAIDAPLIHQIVGTTAASFDAQDPAGVNRIFGVTRLGDITIAIGLSRSEVLGPIDRDFQIDLALFVLVALGSIGAALLVAEFGLLRGVRALKSAALRLKAGKMGLRVKLPAFVAAELHDLAATYNSMTAEFERLAYLDRLTGLPNRRYLERLLTLGKDHGKEKPAHQAVLALDLDGFKPVNDTHGHAVGDRVLAAIARRIASVLDERGVLARVGGDEFVVIIPLVADDRRSEARACAEEIRMGLLRPVEVDGASFPIGCSIGVALVPEDAPSIAGGLMVADAALYEAKRAGRNRVVDRVTAAKPREDGDTRAHWLNLELAGLA